MAAEPRAVGEDHAARVRVGDVDVSEILYERWRTLTATPSGTGAVCG